MNDLISRQAAIDAVTMGALSTATLYGRTDEGATALKETVRAINELPSAQRWIPCKERLPEDEEEVIVSVRDDSGDNTLNYSSCGWYACAGDFWVVDNEANERVIAWCPLPEPYKEHPNAD